MIAVLVAVLIFQLIPVLQPAVSFLFRMQWFVLHFSVCQ